MPKKWAALSKCTFPASLFQLLLYWLHKQTYSKVTTHTTHYMIKTIYWAKVFKCTKSNKGQLLVDLWSDTWLKSNQNWQDQKSLSLPWIIFCSFLSVHSLTLHFLLLHSWITSFFLAFHYGICSFISTESGNFLRSKDKKKWDSWIKRCKGKPTTKALFFSKIRNNMSVCHIETLQILFLVYCCMISVKS